MKRKRLAITLIALLVLLLTAGGASGQGPDSEGEAHPRGEVSIASMVNSRISYQGRLLEDGIPVTGSRDMRFRLYSDGSCTTEVGDEIVRDGVTVSEGLFSVELDVSHWDFNGQGLWLEVEVGPTIMGCQEILPVPYALSLRPGAEIDDTASTINFNRYQLVPFPTITTHKYGIEAEAHGSYSYAYGLRGSATASDGTAYGVYGITDNNDTLSAGVYGNGATQGVRGIGITYGVYGETSNGVAGVRGYHDGAGTGVWGIAGATSGTTYGVRGTSSSSTDDSSGVFGQSQATSGETYGVRGETDSTTEGSAGVYGRADAATGKTYGVQGRTDSTSDDSAGVYGYGSRQGVRGSSHAYTGIGVKGENTSTNSASDGIGVLGTSVWGYGVWGQGGNGVGVKATALGFAAVEARNSADGYGLYAESDGAGADGAAVYAEANGPAGIALWGNSDSTDSTLVVVNDGTGDLIRGFGTGWDFGFRVENNGRTTVPVLEINGGIDLAEQFDVTAASGEVAPGLAVCIDVDHPGRLRVCTEAYDRTVAGIVSGAGGIEPGMVMGQEGSPADGDYPVALTGRVYVWADASAGPIQPGDLLTTADTPGLVMSVTDYERGQGAIIGKAMSTLAEGRGLILVLVSLQ